MLLFPWEIKMCSDRSICLLNKVACKLFSRLLFEIYFSNLYSFALLGPSGCGKTSLIRTLVGRLHPIDNRDGTHGSIFILGKHPHAYGQMVGFMPQEIALHSENTIDEELFFYGRLANMSSQRITQRCHFLTNLLDLTHRQKTISKLSGGQQRRVSFAIALLHEPKLLILGSTSTNIT